MDFANIPCDRQQQKTPTQGRGKIQLLPEIPIKKAAWGLPLDPTGLAVLGNAANRGN